jgi:hypothetical protein
LPQSKKQMKTKTTQIPQTPVFPKALHQLRTDFKPAAPTSKSKKRDNIFSQSRDTREDRGTREMKTTHNSQTLPHGR